VKVPDAKHFDWLAKVPHITRSLIPTSSCRGSSTTMSTQPSKSPENTQMENENTNEMEDLGPPLFRPSCTNCDFCTGLRDTDTLAPEEKPEELAQVPMTATGKSVIRFSSGVLVHDLMLQGSSNPCRSSTVISQCSFYSP
jgi:hypothetical protein